MNRPAIIRCIAAAGLLALTVYNGPASASVDLPRDTEQQTKLCSAACAYRAADCAITQSAEHCSGVYAGCYSSCRLF